MQSLFLNIRGLGVPGHRTLLKVYLRKFKIDILCLQETIKQDFTDQELRSLKVGEQFFWHWLPARGHSGGMLLGVRNNLLEVGNMDMDLYFLSLSVMHKPSNRIFEIIGIYALPKIRRSLTFLS